MVRGDRTLELLLSETADGGERRQVTLVEGESLSLVERSSGPVTEVAYGTRSHGHKLMGSAEAFAHVLGVGKGGIADAVASLFPKSGGEVQLSDVMDMFDAKGERYVYVAWSDEGDVAYRPAWPDDAS